MSGFLTTLGVPNVAKHYVFGKVSVDTSFHLCSGISLHSWHFQRLSDTKENTLRPMCKAFLVRAGVSVFVCV